jgi:hypothetical protein
MPAVLILQLFTNLKSRKNNTNTPDTLCSSNKSKLVYLTTNNNNTVVVVVVVVIVTCHRPLLPGASPLEPMAFPTAQVSIFRLQ